MVMNIDMKNPKIRWIVRNLCRIKVITKSDGTKLIVSDQPLIADNEMSPQELQNLFMIVGDIIDEYVQSIDGDQIDYQELISYVEEKLQ